MKLIPLSQNYNATKNKGMYALVDDEDYDFLTQWKWHPKKDDRRFYVTRGIKGIKRVQIMMHRVIMKIDNPKIFIDHIDHNGLNNQKSNLRICTVSENNKNKRSSGTSKYLGVAWVKRDKKWRTQININKIKKSLGYFENEIDAAKAYDNAAKIHHGEFANLNFK